MESQDNPTARTPAPGEAGYVPPPRALVTLESLQSAGPIGGREWHNFTGTPREIWRLKAMSQGECESGVDVAGKIIPLKYWYLQEVQVYDSAKNEYISTIRTVLMRTDLSCVAFVSAGMVKAIQSMCEAIGVGPYDPPINIAVDQIKTRNGHTYTLIPAE